MWRRKSWRFYFGLPPFGFYSHGVKPFLSKEEHLEGLEQYKKELEEELSEVEKEMEAVRKSL